MIRCKFYKKRNDGVKLYRTFSSKKVKIRKIGTDEVYDEAIDIKRSRKLYEETDQPVDIEETE